MMDTKEALALILSGTEKVMKDNGFTVVHPQGLEKGEVPVSVDGEHSFLDFEGDKGKIRLEAFGKQMLLFVGKEDAEELKKVSANYFDVDTFDEKDIRSLCNELSESLQNTFGKEKGFAGKGKKIPTPVSKSAAKNGTQAYDGNTLANRLTAIYPQLKDAYHENFEKYGVFLAEEFFTEHANAFILETIRKNDAKEMKRLFKMLNDIYENGSNDTQSLVAVTILGEMNNEASLVSAAQEYMCEDLYNTATLVNKFLASNKGKKLKAQLKNPPPYKPKKEKKPGLLSQMMGMGGENMPPM